MHEFSCRAAGASCRAQVSATDRDDLLRQLSAHLRAVHHVEPNETLLSYLESTTRQSTGGVR